MGAFAPPARAASPDDEGDGEHDRNQHRDAQQLHVSRDVARRWEIE